MSRLQSPALHPMPAASMLPAARGQDCRWVFVMHRFSEIKQSVYNMSTLASYTQSKGAYVPALEAWK